VAGYDAEHYNKYRVLEMYTDPDKPNAQPVYRVLVYDRTSDDVQAVEIRPEKRGGGELDEIPFVVIVMVDVDEIPLLGVAQAAYRLDADYRHQLYMSGLEMLFISKAKSEDRPKVIGAGAIRVRLEGQKVRDLIERTAAFDGRECIISLPKDPGQAGKVQAQDFANSLAGYDVRTDAETGSKVVRAQPVFSLRSRF
jgi:hypothetical protein